MVANAWVRDDLATRPSHIPKSIGGLEAQLVEIRRVVRDRARVLRTAVRTQRLLDLMTLHRRGLDQADTYSRQLREHLEEHDGLAPRQRIGVTGGPHMY